ncbi:hypothetical protein AVEN_223300-1 [Araneus ventricosus]|uniref:Uncharacterized protein n=1 Tax=Araneus ventricosus TaxID=182803 RepID=A0A4Y2G8P9_ARAVE|nr:hypothetical protein AVEN_223300-1 [Araneus ventricosus]
MTRGTPELAPFLQASAPHQRENALATTSDLMCRRPTYTVHLQWNRVLNLEPSGLEVKILPLDHRGPRRPAQTEPREGSARGYQTVSTTLIDKLMTTAMIHKNLFVSKSAGINENGVHDPVWAEKFIPQQRESLPKWPVGEMLHEAAINFVLGEAINTFFQISQNESTVLGF